MEAEQLMKSLKKKRGIVKGHLTRFIKFLDNFDGNAVTQLQARYNKFELIYKEFNEIQTEIELGDTIDDDEREDFENNYFQYMAVAENFIKEHTVTKVNDSNLNDTAMSKYAMNIKLPTLKLPTFDGAYDQWLLYFDTFTSIVDSNESISPIQKFQYLRSSLTGDALQIISCLEISTANYDLAWDLLKKRYKNTRLIVHNHMKSLFEIESCQKDSHSSIRILVDNLQKHTRALESLKQPVGTWDTILIYLITQKLDIGTHKEWEELVSKKDTELMPTMEEFIKFLIQRAQVLEVLNRTSKSVTEKPKMQHSTSGKGKSSRTGGNTTSFVTTNKNCTMCNHDSHQLFACDKFLKLSIPERINHIRQAKLCFNCLLSNHVTKDCVSGSCRICQKKHNSLLHLSDPIKSSDQPEPISKKNEVATTSTCHSATPCQTVAILLSTAVVKVCGADGTEKQLRVLLDSGSQSHFITKHACELLNLKPTQTSTTVTGICDSVTSTHQQVNVTIQSRITSFKATLNFLVMPKITGNLPLVNVSLLQLNLPHNIQLADPTFHQSSPVDMLIGAEIFFELLCIGQFKPTVHSPTFQKTKLGWIVTGKITSEDHPNRTICHFSRSTIDEKLAKFWEIEEIETNKRSQSTEDMKCEQHFRDTFDRDTEGRFTVSLPFNSNITQLGNSKAIALQRFKTLKKKLQRNTDLHIQYSNFMQEYEQLGHMTAIPDLDEETDTCYLPHHAVLKEDSSTTRLRVVFDASAKTTSGISLNDTLLKGPTIQDDLIDILLRFRKHNIVLTADITKMYRQINMNPQDANRQLIFWRNHPNKPLQTYKLNTVTYGTTPAPFLAVRCLEQLATEEQSDFPEASRVLRNDFYVDDLLSGSDTFEHAEKIMHELLHLLKRGCFDLRKWRSNIPELLTHLSDNQIDKTILTIEKEVAVKTLGLLWNSHSDSLMFSVGQVNQSAPITKRRILSCIAQIFDPLGILGPVITTAKIIMQQLWELKLGWDESIPERLHTSWIDYQSQLVYLNQLHVPRKMTTHSSYTTLEIHGFCDASQAAYGACVYIRTTDTDGCHSSQLLCSKSRVAPLKTITLPRLELCGALLLAKLVNKVIEAVKIIPHKIFYWTDSTITLAWIAGSANTWKTFVSNRVSEIQTLAHNGKWVHVNTKENPADLISRGKSPQEVIDSKLWWNGPHWLVKDTQHWPKLHTIDENRVGIDELEKRKVTALISTEQFHIWGKYSKLTKLVRVTAFCLRFKHNVCQSDHTKTIGPLTPHELTNATYALVKLAQATEFSRELDDLKANKGLHTKSRLLSLNPFIDQDGLLRVGGRLHHSRTSYDQKHQILLPSSHELTRLIISHEHVKQLHAGPHGTLAAVRSQYWPIAARNTVRQVVRQCVPCFKIKPKPLQHIMGDIPRNRTEQTRPFFNTGVDYCGPFNIREGLRKNTRLAKAYGAIFVCMVTKAVHIELVSTLSTEGFLNALKRFISRRGKPAHMFSDNGTNFRGANNELKELHELFSTSVHQNKIVNTLAEDRINWHFIPARAPHFGGIWEAAVKSLKHHIRRVAGEASLTFEQLYTLIVQIEACLNSRPICSLSNDPNDLSFLTPGHFLIGDSLTAIAEPDITSLNVGRLSQWQHVQQLQQHFWSRWHKEYISELQQRRKWKSQMDPVLKAGNLVIIREDNVPPLQWHVGRVELVHPGHDGIVRAATVRTTSGSYKRPVVRLCLLPIDDNYS